MRVWIASLVALAGCGRINYNDGVVDARPPVPCVAPPADCNNAQVYECDGRCYTTCTVDRTYPAAAASCAEWGGCLATVFDVNDNNCTASRLTGVAWIGLRQDNSAMTPGEKWAWCDGTPLEAGGFSAWGTGAPNDFDGIENGSDNCGLMTAGANWGDWHCEVTEPQFVCSRPL